MKVTKETWEVKLNNLHTRTNGISSEHQIDYKSLLKKVFIGNKVFDIGCGTCWLKKMLPKETHYIGLDAFVKGDDIINDTIEDFETLKSKVDTSFIFAALDGMRDLNKAFLNIKNVTSKNVVILTGINIEPDIYHTHLITEEFLDDIMYGWSKTTRVQVHPKIIFLEYTK